MLFLLYATAYCQDFVNTAVTHVIDLSQTITREQLTIQVEPNGKTDYYLNVGSPDYISVTDQDNELPVVQEKDLYKVIVPQKTKLVVKLVYSNKIAPYPKAISQKDTQYYEYIGNAHFVSPYPTKSSKTSVKVKNVRSSEPSGTPTNNQLRYSYSDVEPNAQTPLKIQYQSNEAILVAKTFDKTVHVSHWTGLVVKEDYQVVHAGAQLKGFFSRIDFKLNWHSNQNTNVQETLVCTLPRDVTDVYYKDAIGNVSTSNLRQESKKSVLELKPRFPLYGGWKYTWFHGYTVPLTDYLSVGDHYTISLPYLGCLSNVATENATLKIVLPEGAQVLNIKVPFEVDETKESLSFTYFDTTGRPTITIKGSHLVDEHQGNVVIAYSLENWRFVQKPLAIAAYVFGFYVLLMIYARLDLSLKADPEVEKRRLLEGQTEQLTSLLEQESLSLKSLDKLMEIFKSSKDSAAFEKKVAAIESEIHALHEKIQQLINASVSAEWGKTCQKLLEAAKNRLKTIRANHAVVVSFVLNPQQDKKKLVQQIEKAQSQISEFSISIQKLLSRLE